MSRRPGNTTIIEVAWALVRISRRARALAEEIVVERPFTRELSHLVDIAVVLDEAAQAFLGQARARVQRAA